MIEKIIWTPLEMLWTLLDLLLSCFNYVFWCFCGVIHHCFRFIEIIAHALGFIVEIMKLLLECNNAIISFVIYVLSSAYNFIFYTTPNNMYDAVTEGSQMITNVSVNALTSSTDIVHHLIFKLPALLYNGCLSILTNFFFVVSSTSYSVFTYTWEYGATIITLTFTLLQGILYVFMTALYNVVIKIPMYVVTISECVWQFLLIILKPFIYFVMSGAEVLSRISIRCFVFLTQFLFRTVCGIGAMAISLFSYVTQIPVLAFGIGCNILAMVRSSVYILLEPLSRVYSTIEELVIELGVQEFFLGLFLSVLFIAFGIFVLQYSDAADFNSVDLMNYFRLPTWRFVRPVVHDLIQMEPLPNVLENQEEPERVRNETIQSHDQSSIPYNAREEASTIPDDNDNMICVICKLNQKSVLLLPCKHLCLCADCIRTILNLGYQEHKCPLCRKKIRDYIDVYL